LADIKNMLGFMNEHLQTILRKMCDVVGADAEKVDFGKHDWYTDYEWTMDEGKEFREWMIDYLYNDNKARKSMCKVNKKTKKHLGRVADEFCFQYGWKYRDV